MPGTWRGDSTGRLLQRVNDFFEADARPKMFHGLLYHTRSTPEHGLATKALSHVGSAIEGGALLQMKVGAGVEGDVSCNVSSHARKIARRESRGAVVDGRYGGLGIDTLSFKAPELMTQWAIATTSLAQSVLCRGSRPW